MFNWNWSIFTHTLLIRIDLYFLNIILFFRLACHIWMRINVHVWCCLFFKHRCLYLFDRWNSSSLSSRLRQSIAILFEAWNLTTRRAQFVICSRFFQFDVITWAYSWFHFADALMSDWIFYLNFDVWFLFRKIWASKRLFSKAESPMIDSFSLPVKYVRSCNRWHRSCYSICFHWWLFHALRHTIRHSWWLERGSCLYLRLFQFDVRIFYVTNRAWRCSLLTGRNTIPRLASLWRRPSMSLLWRVSILRSAYWRSYLVCRATSQIRVHFISLK